VTSRLLTADSKDMSLLMPTRSMISQQAGKGLEESEVDGGGGGRKGATRGGGVMFEADEVSEWSRQAGKALSLCSKAGSSDA